MHNLTSRPPLTKRWAALLTGLSLGLGVLTLAPTISQAALDAPPLTFDLPAPAEGVLQIPLRSIAAANPQSADRPIHTITTQPVATSSFDVAGVSWADGVTPVDVSIRTFVAGHWTQWFSLGLGRAAEAPDPDSVEAATARPATEPVVVPGSTGIQIRVVGSASAGLPADLAATVVPNQMTSQSRVMAAVPSNPPTNPPGQTPSQLPSISSSGTLAPAPGASPTPVADTVARDAAGNPIIHRRSEWGANESLVEDKNRKPFTTLRGAVVHHTDGSNNYTAAQVPGIINGIFVYHVKSRGWNDIGYNFLVDKFGGIWEGRAGGITENVIGAQASGFNAETFGVSVLGSYEKTPITDSAIASLRALLAWRLALGGLTDPAGTTTYTHLSGPRSVIIGHRDAAYKSTGAGIWYNQTDCPGAYLYARLGELRQPATTQIETFVADQPRVSVQTGRVTRGQKAAVTAAWTGGGQGLTGAVRVMRWNGSAWVNAGQINVINGRGRLAFTAKTTSTFRLRALTLAAPDQARLELAKVWSQTTSTVRVTAAKAKKTPTLLAASHVQAGSTTPLTVQWRGYKGRPAKIILQTHRNGRWVDVVKAKVSAKTKMKTLRVTITKTSKWRVIAQRSAVKPGVKRPKSTTVKIRTY